MLSEATNEDKETRAHLVAPGGVATRIADLIEPAIADLGYELVRVRLTGEQGQTLQLMAERPDGTMQVADCEAVSRTVSAILDVEDPIKGHYVLEVSSPGIGRPLTREKDFETWAGFEAKIELTQMLAGRKRFRGILQGTEDGEVLLQMPVDGHDEPQIVGLPFRLIGDARLVMTDDLIAEAGKRQASPEAGSKEPDA
ncbi:MAG: ribosome maturation factor RimP [Parvibaculaceae bacterium]